MQTLRFAGQTIFARAITRFWIEPVYTVAGQQLDDEYHVSLELITGVILREPIKSTLPKGYGASTNAELRRDQVARTLGEIDNDKLLKDIMQTKVFVERCDHDEFVDAVVECEKDLNYQISTRWVKETTRTGYLFTVDYDNAANLFYLGRVFERKLKTRV